MASFGDFQITTNPNVDQQTENFGQYYGEDSDP